MQATEFKAWSFSRFNDWTKCPALAKYKYLQKVTTEEMAERFRKEQAGEVPENPLQRGTRIDELTSKYLRSPRGTLPSDIAALGPQYKALKKHDLTVNDSWGFDRDWKPCNVTDWDRCWLRVKIDVNYIEHVKKVDVLHIIDNKTGRYRLEKYEEYQMQLDLYGVAGLARMPTVTEVRAQLYYSDEGIVYPTKGPIIFIRGDLEMMQKAWLKRLKPYFNDRAFRPRPGYYCTYCDYSKKKGGPCKY